jgi:hypothetical protein
MKSNLAVLAGVTLAIAILAVYAFLPPLARRADDLPPELRVEVSEAEEVALPAEGEVVALDFFFMETAELPPDAELEVRSPQLERVLEGSAPEDGQVTVALDRPYLQDVIDATQRRADAGERPGAANQGPAGVFDVELWSDGQRIASRTVAVAGEAEGPLSPRITWGLDAADAAYDPERLFEVPVRVVAQVERRGRLVPYRLEETATLLLRDIEGGFERREIELPAGRLMSDPVMVPLRPKDSYRLVAEPTGGVGEPSEPLEVTWASHGPNLALEVMPAEQDRFASQADPARLRVYLSLAGRRVRPPEGAVLAATPPRGVSLEPTPPKLDSRGVWSTAAYAGGSLAGARIDFADLEFGLQTAAQVDFTYPTWQLLWAILAGAVGVLVARRRKLFEGGRVAAALETLTSMVAAGLLYASLVAGWLPTLPGILAPLPAIAVGLLGGYLGDAVFHLLIKRLLPTVGGAPAGGG